MDSAILAQVVRGDTVESIHRGHFIVLDGEGSTVAQAGDPDTVTFYRSSCKFFQAVPLIISGAADEFGFDEEEIARMLAGEKISDTAREHARELLAATN